MTEKKSNGAGGKPTEGEVSALHEASNRRGIMQECASELRRIKAERAELNEQAGDIRKRLRDIGIEPKPFELALRIADLDDAVARDNYMTAFQESWDALEPGGQLDFISAVDRAENAPDHDVTEPEAA